MSSNAVALEDIAIGEVALKAAARTIAKFLQDLNDRTAHELFDALQSWVWKTLDARRRDDDLAGWVDLLARSSSMMERNWPPLSIKLDGYIDLLQTSVVVGRLDVERAPLKRKHVYAILLEMHRQGGKLRRQVLMRQLRLKEANLTRIMSPLRDMGWVTATEDGRELFYRLTEKGRASTQEIAALAWTQLQGPSVVFEPGYEKVRIVEIEQPSKDAFKLAYRSHVRSDWGGMAEPGDESASGGWRGDFYSDKIGHDIFASTMVVHEKEAA
jgi:DNA-binding MarR family transcriptional regulator